MELPSREAQLRAIVEQLDAGRERCAVGDLVGVRAALELALQVVQAALGSGGPEPIGLLEEREAWDPVPLTPTHDSGRIVLHDAEPKRPTSTIPGLPPLTPPLFPPRDELSVTREFPPRAALTHEGADSLSAIALPPSEDALLPERISSRDTGEEQLSDASHHAALEALELVEAPLPTLDAPSGAQAGLQPDVIDESLQRLMSLELSQVVPVVAEEEPYAALDLLPLEVAAASDDSEDSVDQTNPFIRAKLATYVGQGGESALPTSALPGVAPAAEPLTPALLALQAGQPAAAIDACEAALAVAGGLDGGLALEQRPLLEQIYGAILGGPECLPVPESQPEQLDPRAAFLLSRIDGALTVEDVLDVAGMPRLEALRGLALLVRHGNVSIKSPRG